MEIITDNNKEYKTFHVVSNDAPDNENILLNNKIDSLMEDGWNIDYVKCRDNVFSCWKGEERKFYGTKTYTIYAYHNDLPCIFQICKGEVEE